MKYLRKFEDAEIVYKPTTGGLYKPFCSYLDGDARAFGYVSEIGVDDRMVVAESSSVYHESLDDDGRNRLNLINPGRLWLDKKIISFWVFPKEEG